MKEVQLFGGPLEGHVLTIPEDTVELMKRHEANEFQSSYLVYKPSTEVPRCFVYCGIGVVFK